MLPDDEKLERLRARSMAREMRDRQRMARSDFMADLWREFQLFRYRRLARCPEVPLPTLPGTKLAAAISVARRHRRGAGKGSEGGGHWRLSVPSVSYGRGPSSDGFFA